MIDPDLNFFDEIKLMRLTQKSFLYETQRFESISVLHVNIRGLKTNFENFGNLLNNKGSSFNTETWCSNSEIINSSRFDISKYNAILFKRRTNKREGSVLIYVKTDFMDQLFTVIIQLLCSYFLICCAQTKITYFFSNCHCELNTTDLSVIVKPSQLCVTVISIITYQRHYLCRI